MKQQIHIDGHGVVVAKSGTVRCPGLSRFAFPARLIDEIGSRIDAVERLAALEKASDNAWASFRCAESKSRVENTKYSMRFTSTGLKVGCTHIPIDQLRAIIAASKAARKKGGRK